MDIILNKKTIKNIKTDSLKFGMALFMVQIFSNNNLFEENCKNTKIILMSLCGFMVYQLIVSKIINTTDLDIRTRVPIDDFFKFTTMLIVSRFLISEKNVSDKKIIVETINIITMFTFYNSFISKYITTKFVSDTMTFRDMMALNDSVKYTFVIITSEILNNLAGFGKNYIDVIKFGSGYVFGLIIYDYLLSQ